LSKNARRLNSNRLWDETKEEPMCDEENEVAVE
jgi:hypothetical protein